LTLEDFEFIKLATVNNSGIWSASVTLTHMGGDFTLYVYLSRNCMRGTIHLMDKTQDVYCSKVWIDFSSPLKGYASVFVDKFDDLDPDFKDRMERILLTYGYASAANGASCD